MKEGINDSRKESIVRYLMTSLSKKAIKVSQFCEASGIDPMSMSRIKKSEYWNKVSGPVWSHLNGIYEAQSFEDVMRGAISKFIPKSQSGGVKPKSKKNPKEEKPVESSYEKHMREERERFAKMKANTDQQEKEEHVDHSVMRIRRIPHSAIPISNQEKSEAGVIQQPDITVGMAIDALIKAGAKINISLEV